jgi:Domain of Unknown Function (DUF928)
MRKRVKPTAVLIGFLAVAVAGARVPASAQVAQGEEIRYKPPLRGAPGQRVGGASRGLDPVSAPGLTIDLLAPDGHAGQTISQAPTLYYFVSARIDQRIQLTISAPRRAVPLLETDIPAPRGPGLYALRLADMRARLDENTLYTWSISVITDPRERANDIVASASLLRTVPDPGLDGVIRAAPPQRRAAVLAQAGLWYDAVAAAAEAKDQDRHAALDSLLDQVGLTEAARYDRQGASSGR